MVRQFAFALILTALTIQLASAEPPAHARWRLSFADEFDQPQINWDVWASEEGPRGPDRLEGRWPENNVLQDGLLRQTIKREDPARGGKDWSSAHLWTKAFTQQYGYFECRMRYGKYLNNAFWLYRPSGLFPRPHFEIDINEGHTPREVATCFHWYTYYEEEQQGDLNSAGKNWQADVDLDQDFHVYAVEWNERLIIWYFDGKPIRVLQNAVAHAPADVRLSTVMMPQQLEKDGVALETMAGVSMDVDWVRVYEKVEDLAQPEFAPVEPLMMPVLSRVERQIPPAQRGEVALQEDFQQAEEGKLPAGWEIGDGQPTVMADPIMPARAEGNRLLRLGPLDYAYRMFPRPLQGLLEIELDVFMPQKDLGLLLVTVGQFDAADPEARKTSYHTGDIGPYIHWQSNWLDYYTETNKWTHMARYPTAQWQHARFVLDVPRGVFDYYAGEGEGAYVSGGVFRHNQQAALGLALRNRGEGQPVYVDNVVVRELTP